MSLATKFNDNEFVTRHLPNDAWRKHIRMFFLPGQHISPEVTCKANQCKVRLASELDNAVSASASSEQPTPMCFCYACDRTFHLDCEDLDLEDFTEENSGPYLCVECDTTPLNAFAVEYYNTNKWKAGIVKRRQSFIKADSIEKFPALMNEQLTDDEFDDQDISALTPVHKKVDESFGTVPIETYQKQQNEMMLMVNKYKELEIESNKSKQSTQQQIDALMDELQKLKLSVKQNPTPVHQPQTKEVVVPPVMTVESLLRKTYIADEATKQNPTPKPKEKVIEKSTAVDEFCNNSNITIAERVLLATTKAQIESTKAQLKVSDAMILEQRRKALPKIAKFKGEAKSWIRFKKEVERYKDTGCFDDEAIKMYVLGALEGVALKRVQDMIDLSSLDEVMRILESSFGNSPSIIKSCEAEILKFKLKGDLMRNDVVAINALIQTYFTSCKYAKVAKLNSNMLAEHILSQMSGVHKLFFRQYYHRERPNDVTNIPDLDILFTFLESIASDLDVRADDQEKRNRPSQVHSIATNSNSNSNSWNVSSRSRDSYKFEIKDCKTAQYVGYEMSLVNQLTKKCECCGRSGHFTIECASFKAMSQGQREDLINSKRLCKSCLLTSEHQYKECSIKRGCGFKIGSNRCAQKHHILLHSSSSGNVNRERNGRSYQGRRSNTNNNARRANEIIQRNSQVANQSRQSELNENALSANQSQTLKTEIEKPIAQQNYHAISTSQLEVKPRHVGVILSNDRTVKVFKHFIFGPKLETIGYSIGDSGAEITLIRNDLRKALGIEGEPATVRLQWTDGTIISAPAVKVSVELKGLSEDAETIKLDNCYAIDELNLPPRSLNVDKLKQQFPYLANVEFENYENISPSILIGSPHAACFEAVEPIIENGEGKPVAIKSKLGWSIFGGEPENYPETPCAVQSVTLNDASLEEMQSPKVSNEELYDLLTYFNSLESLGIKPSPHHFTEDELKAMELILEEMRILSNGSIEVPLIWNRDVNKNIPHLPNNYFAVNNRQQRQEDSLAKNPERLKAYNDNFKELINEGYVRRATEHDLNTKWENIWYLPMSLVVNANKLPVKYRNVYDASAKYQGISLNDKLLMGPNFLVEILQPLFKMRSNKIAFTCDVKSMFHRIFISERDQQCQRILWRESITEPMQTYIQQVMLFGPKSSPFTSQYVKNVTAEKWADKYPKASETLRKFTYMDDVLTSAPTVEEAVNIALHCIEILKSINWDLIGFQSNSIEFLKRLPEQHVKHDLIPIIAGEVDNHTTKVLGCAWDTRSDCFVFGLNKNLFIQIVKDYGHRPTKRDQCSTIARIYDVLGLIAHYVIRGRILLQRSWRNKLKWNDEISEEENINWKKWLDEIENIAKLKIPRQLTQYNDISKAGQIELHVMCDAGKEAFAAVAYFVSTFHGFRTSKLVMAKAKVTPLKLKSRMEIHEMPRLELLACLIAARLADTITRLFPNLKMERFLWTDSEVVLRWLKNPNQRLIKFAISPIDEILDKTDRHEWNYVPSQLNAADIATKFQKFDFGDVNSIWFKGPRFLSQPKTCWPMQKNFEPNENADALLLCNVNVSQITFVSPIKLPLLTCPIASDIIVDRLDNCIKSNWIKLIRAIARALKIYDAFIAFIIARGFVRSQEALKIKDLHKWNELEPEDYERAELFIIRKMQRESYPEEYKALLKNQFFSNKELSQLDIFLDDQKVMRIASRVELDSDVYPQRFAPLVPRKHPLTRILLYHYHKAFAHVHLESQIAAIRSSYWIPQIRSALQSIKGNCNTCQIIKAKPVAPKMAPLPLYRVNPNLEPFRVTGVDCSGALTYYKNNRPYKAYILLFTCTVTRYIHVQLIDNLDTLSVLEAIVTLYNAHGPISHFISDNGTNFVGAARRLKRDQEDVTQLLKTQRDTLSQELAEKYKLSWKFIPAYSPWFGGFYERLIKEIKRAIELTIKNKKLSRKELNIGIQEGAFRINCRPLTHNPITSEEEEVLTPHHLAKNRSGWPLPSRSLNEYDHSDKDDRMIYHRGRKVADEITRRFLSQYLPILTKRTKWFKDTKELAAGDLVLLIEPNSPRAPYQRAKVIDVHTGRDGHVRVVDVELPDKTTRTKYSAQRVAKIEIKKLDDAL